MGWLFGPNVKRLEGRRDVAGLQAIVRTGSPQLRWDAAAALGRLGETAALAGLADERPALPEDARRACASALASVDDPAAEKWLEQAMADADERVREIAAKRLAGKLQRRVDADVDELLPRFAAKVSAEPELMRSRGGGTPTIIGFHAGCDPEAAWWVSPRDLCKVRDLGDAGSPEVATRLAEKLARKFVAAAPPVTGEYHHLLRGRALPVAAPNTKLSSHVTAKPSRVYVVTTEERELMGVGFVVA